MGNQFPITRESRRVLQEHVGLYSDAAVFSQKLGISLLPKDPEAWLETESLSNGDLQFTLTFPLDNNSDPSDGRAYLTETLRWDPRDQKIRKWTREINLPPDSLWSPDWKSRLEKIYDLPQPNSGDPRLAALAKDLAFAQPRSLPDDFKKALKGNSGFIQQLFDPLAQLDAAWQLKVGAPAFYSHGVPDHRRALAIGFPVFHKAYPGRPALWLLVRFFYHPVTGELQRWEREWSVHPEAPRDRRQEWVGLVEDLAATPPPDREQAEEFFSWARPHFKPGDRPIRAVDIPWEGSDLLMPLSRFRTPPGMSRGVFGERIAEREGRKERREEFKRRAAAFLAAAQGQSFPHRDRALRELESISQETDEAIWKKSLWLWVEGNFLQKEWRPDAVWTLLQAAPELFAEEKGARDFLAMTQGKGKWGRNLEFQLNGIGSEAIRPLPILAMAGVGLVGPMARATAFRHLSKFGAAGRVASFGIGLGTEAAAFTTLNRGLGGGGHPWGSDFLANLLWLGGLKLTHGLSAPIVAQAPGRYRTAAELLSHGMAIGAMHYANRLSRHWGLLKDEGFPWGGGFTGEMIGYLHTMTGFSLVNRMTGNFFPRMIKRMEVDIEAARWERARRRWFQARGLLPDAPASATLGPGAPVKFFVPGQAELVLTRWDSPQNPQWEYFPSGGFFHLDTYLFGRNTQHLRVKRDSQGFFQLWDDRTLRSPEAQSLHHTMFDMNFIRDVPLYLQGRPVPTQQWVSLRPVEVLSFLGRSLGLHFTPLDPVFSDLLTLPVNLQQFLAQEFSRIKTAQDFFTVWENPPWPQVAGLWERIERVWKGEAPLISLPFELGIQAGVGSWMAREVEKWKRDGFSPGDLVFSAEAEGHRWLPHEAEYRRGQAWKKMRQAVAEAKDLSELRLAVAASDLHLIEGREMSGVAQKIGGLEHANLREVQDLPYTAGIRQKARDLLERESFEKFFGKDPTQTLNWIRDRTLARNMNVLLGAKDEIRQKIMRLGPIQGGARTYQPEEVLEILYDVLDRGKPLALLTENHGIREMARAYQRQVIAVAERLFAREMLSKVDLFSGERVSEQNPESQFRQALHVLNSHAGWPVRGLPRPKEIAQVTDLVRRHLDPSASPFYPENQALLRKHIDGVSQEALAMFKKADPAEKALLLDTYFGNYRRRDFPAETAFQVAVLMAQAGLYREVGVTYDIRGDQWRPTLSLGDLSFISPENGGDFFLMHSHPEEYLAEAGHILGGMQGPERLNEGGFRTMYLRGDESVNGDTRNIIFSEMDVREFAREAQSYWNLGYPKKFGATPLYEPENRVFKNFVFHPYGASEIRFQLGETGRLQKVVVRYASQGDRYLRDEGYLRSIDRLKSMETELGVPFEFHKISAGEFVKNLPFPIFSFLHH